MSQQNTIENTLSKKVGAKMKSVDEKYNYNKVNKSPFSFGYTFGVKAYRSYSTVNAAQKKKIKADIDFNKKIATGDSSRGSVQYAKGFMCAIRDCAKERKGKRN